MKLTMPRSSTASPRAAVGGRERGGSLGVMEEAAQEFRSPEEAREALIGLKEWRADVYERRQQ